MDKISEEDKTFIRKYWATYYNKIKELENLEADFTKLIRSVEQFEKKNDFSSYCFQMYIAYSRFSDKDTKILDQRGQVEQTIERSKTAFLKKLNKLDLYLEEREYALVNGLEDEEYKKIQNPFFIKL